jgi:hypothetical protein
MTEIAENEFFRDVMTPKAINKRSNLDMVMKAYVILSEYDNPTIDAASVRQIVSERALTDEDIERLNSVFDRLHRVYELNINPKIRKVFKSKTHILSIVWITYKSVSDNRTDENFKSWVCHFFGSANAVSISEEYNDNYLNHTTDKKSLKRRLKAVHDDYIKYFG